MSDNEEVESDEKAFCIERAKQGRAACKKCKQKCAAGELRLAKLIPNPFGEGKMKQWFHIPCLLEQFLTQRATTKRIEYIGDIDGWDELSEKEQKEILTQINENEKKFADKHGAKFTPIKFKAVDKPSSKNKGTSKNDSSQHDKNHRDNLFREFRRLVADVTNESSYLEKSAIIKNKFTNGSDGTGFKGDLTQWCRLLLPGVIKRIYNLQSRQLVNIFSGIFRINRDEMLEHLEQGDIGETIQHYFENNKTIKPNKKSLVTMQDVDSFLEELTKRTRDQDYDDHFRSILPKCTANDLKLIIRLVKHDLRMNAGAKPVLDAVHSDAYAAFQSSRDLDSVLERILNSQDIIQDDAVVTVSIKVMTPVLPMLATACKSVEQAMKKCPNGMYSEIKYDGERVQVHKHGTDFKYFSRSLKPVMHHKVDHFQKYIPQAFPHANDLILDSEILLIDTTDGKPLPFGSLGKHKKHEFKGANVCLFVFDCIYYNGDSLTHKPIHERKSILKANMIEIQNHIMFSEMEVVHKATDLAAMIAKVLGLGLEGLVLKDLNSVYAPGKRHWLKVKKDYLNDGAMADTADLIVLGAWFGTGKKGGMMSVFLMGCYDKYSRKFCTVTKVHTGHDDKTLEKLQSELDMIKISASEVPDWLTCSRIMIPDFVARDPKKQPVWEITGAEFTQHDVHTADGISIRFPRVTRIRHDKHWESATDLEELKMLVKTSKEKTDFNIIVKAEDDTKDTTKIKVKKEVKETSTELNIINKTENEIKNIKQEIKIEKEEQEIENNKRSSNQCDFNVKKNKIAKTDVIMYPDIFNNIKLVPIKLNNDLLRYFIAYGGDLLDLDQCEFATHVLHDTSEISDLPMNCSQSARHITVDWIKDSIGNGCIQDTRPYTVQWIP